MKRVGLLKFKSSPTVATLLGEVSMTWSQLEFGMQMFIAMLTELDLRVASVFTYRAGMERWIEWSQHIIALRYGANELAIADWEATVAALRKAQGERNGLTHALLTSSPQFRGIRTRKIVQRGKGSSRHLQSDYPTISVKDLRDTLRSIESGIEMLNSWKLEYLFPMGAQKPQLPDLP